MCLRPRGMFLICCIHLFLLVEGMLGETAPPEKHPPGLDWAPHTETVDIRWPSQQSSSVSPDAEAYESEGVLLEESPLRVVAIGGLPAEGGGEGGGETRPKKPRKTLHTTALIKGLRVSATLLLFMSLVVVGLRAQRARKPAVPDARMAEALKKFEKIREMVPTAERLAAAVGTKDAEKFLATLQSIMSTISTPTLKSQDTKRLEDACTDALVNIRRLHQSALNFVKSIVEADKPLAEFPPLVLWGTKPPYTMSAAEEKIRTLFVGTHQSLGECAEKLRLGFDEGVRRVFAAKHFEDERDGSVLLDAARAVEDLVATSATRNRLDVVASKARQDAVRSLKLMFMRKHDAVIKRIKWHANLLQVYARLSGSGLNAKDAAKTEDSHFEAIKEGVGKATGLLEELQSCVRKVQKSAPSEVSDALIADAARIGEEAQDVLKDCLALARASTVFPESVNSSDRDLLKKAAQKEMETLEAQSEVLYQALKDVHKSTLSTKEIVYKDAALPINTAIFLEKIQAAKGLRLKEQKRADDALSVAKTLSKVSTVEDGVKALLKLDELARSQEEDIAAAQEMKIRSRFSAFLVDDMHHTRYEVDRASARAPELSGAEKRRHAQLLEQFNAARKAAQKAMNLLEAATAAADMRAYCAELQNSLLGFEPKTSQTGER